MTKGTHMSLNMDDLGLSDDLPLLQLDLLVDVTDGDESLIQELLELYVEDVTTRMADMRKNLEERDYVSAEREAHTIKGSSSNVGALRIQRWAHYFEQELKNQSAQHVDALLALFDKEFKEIQQTIAQRYA